MRIAIYHNISRDASFGLNMVFDSQGKFYEGQSHELVKVHEIDSLAPCLAEPDNLFWAFNVGHEDASRSILHDVALSYRARKLRSLSVGDVVCIDGKYLACASSGWTEVQAGELRVLSARAAEVCIRRRYDMTRTEELTITVPLSDDTAWPKGKTFGELTPTQKQAAIKQAAAQFQAELTANADAISAVLEDTE